MPMPRAAVTFNRSAIGLPPSWFENAMTQPRAIMPWTAEVQQATTVHDVLNGDSPDVTLRTPATRAGTMRLLYDNATEAAEALDVFNYPCLFRAQPVGPVGDSALPIWMPVYFAAVGTTRTLKDETSAAWFLEVGWRAV